MSVFEETPGSDQNQGTGEPVKPEDKSNEVDQLLDSIKNESGERKYKTVDEALKGAAHAQTFIEQLKKEKAEMEAQLADRKRLEELLTSKESTQEGKEAASQMVQGLTSEDVVKILEQRDVQLKQKQNADKVVNAAKEAFGTEYITVLKEKAAQAGLTQELADSMAQTSPDALLKLLGIAAKVDTKSLMNSQSSLERKPGDKQESIPKFDPFRRNRSKLMETWEKVGESTKARLGQK